MEYKDFDINKVKAKDKLEVVLSVRITQKDFEWIKANRISATKLFNYCLHEIMKQEVKKEVKKK